MKNLRLCKAIEHLVQRWGPIDGRTRLVKLVYLADRTWRERTGSTYTEARYFRYNHGPFAQEILTAVDWMDGLEIVERTIPHAQGIIYRYASGGTSRLTRVTLDPAFVEVLDETASAWGRRPLRELLDAVYSMPDFSRSAFGDVLLQ